MEKTELDNNIIIPNINSDKPNFYLLIYNISKSKNLGTLIRSASAFGVKDILVLGENKKILKKLYGSKGTVQKSSFIFFDNIDDLKKFTIDNNIHIYGIEIGDKAERIDKVKFKGNTLFVLGNEGLGMNNKQKELCGDNLVYIPQYSDKTGSLNIACAGSIIFHHFALWANYQEALFTEEKYNVIKTKQDIKYIKGITNNNDNITDDLNDVEF